MWDQFSVCFVLSFCGVNLLSILPVFCLGQTGESAGRIGEAEAATSWCLLRSYRHAKAHACVRLAVMLLCHPNIPVKRVLVTVLSGVEKAM